MWGKFTNDEVEVVGSVADGMLKACRRCDESNAYVSLSMAVRSFIYELSNLGDRETVFVDELVGRGELLCVYVQPYVDARLCHVKAEAHKDWQTYIKQSTSALLSTTDWSSW